jgi:hypothetical protein
MHVVAQTRLHTAELLSLQSIPFNVSLQDSIEAAN